MSQADLGTFRRMDPSVIDDDPNWSVLRRRHRDVDIVVPPGTGQPPVDVADADDPDGADLPTLRAATVLRVTSGALRATAVDRGLACEELAREVATWG